MATQYPYLRLLIPTLSQGNDHNADSAVWCGRTTSAMIQNYYIAARNGGIEAAQDLLIINNQDPAVANLAFRGGPKKDKVAVDGYNLVAGIQQQKPETWVQHHLFPLDDGGRAKVLNGQMLTEPEIEDRLAPIIQGLEVFNPAIIYTSLSTGNGVRRRARHLVCVSGYRRDSGGALWLHIDDPSSMAFDGEGELRPLSLERVMEGTKPAGIDDAIQQLHPDMLHHERPGRRYWIRAAVLFRPNPHSVQSSKDFWCDHQDSPGFRVYVNHVPEPRSSMVDVGADPRYPVSLPEGVDVTSQLWDAVAGSGDPYPLSARRSWHNGIHIPETPGVTTDRNVYAAAPGRVVLAWFPERKPDQPDRGMVIVRHAIDTRTLSIVDAREDEPPEGAIWLHSLYANLEGGSAGADALLGKLKPAGAKPKPRLFARIGAPKLMLLESGATLEPVPAEELDADTDAAELVGIEGTEFFALEHPKTNVEFWTDAAQALLPNSPHSAPRLRLAKNLSRLVGVELSGKPWVLDDDVIKVAPGATTGRVFFEIKGAGASRYFPERKSGRGTQYVDVAVTAETTLKPVHVFRSNGLDRALVEVRDVVDGISNNDAEIAEYERLETSYLDLSERLCGSGYVDLEGEDPDFRDVVDAPIGRMGVQSLGGVDPTYGVHIEVFCTQNLATMTQAGGRWSEMVEVAGMDNGTADFFRAQLEAVLSAGPSKQGSGGALTSDPSLVGNAGDARPTSLLSLLEDGSPITPGEWVAHCKQPEHARELSQLVVKHRSEWTLDLVEDASNRTSLRKIPTELRTALFPASLGQPGLDTDTYYYFHPLRLIEWLRTGLDVSLHDLPTSARDGIDLVLRLGDLELDLLRQSEADNYRLRLVLGNGADAQDGEDDDDVAGVARGVLVMHGVDSENTEIEVELSRHNVTRLYLTQPGGTVSAPREIGAGAFATEFQRSGILCEEGKENAVHVLTDGAGPLPDLACGKVTVVAEVRYNVAVPDRVKISAPGGSFAFESIEIGGASFDEPAGGWGVALEHDLVLRDEDEDDTDEDEDELITASSSVFVKAVLVGTSTARVQETLDIEVSGGDLSAPVTGSFELVQRDIVQGSRGQDVAKLQVYLSQIRCGTFGCLRGKGPAGVIDGDYGTNTGLALWRFLLNYRPWAGLQPIPAQNGDAQTDGLAREPSEIDELAVMFQEQYGGPNVTQELLDVIVEHYRVPFVGVGCSMTVDPPTVEVSVPELDTKWTGWSTKHRTRVLPIPGLITLHFDVRLTTSAPGDLSTVGVSVDLEHGDAYTLTSAGCTSLADLVASGITLVPSGELNEGTPRLVVSDDSGAQLFAVELGGSTDVRNKGTEKGLDAIIVQHWLKNRTNKKGKPYLGGSVDGDFGSGSKSAFDAFVGDTFKKKDDPTYVEILQSLRSEPVGGAMLFPVRVEEMAL